MYRYPRAFQSTVIWVKPKKIYRITTDQKTWDITADWINYKAKYRDLYKQGYTNVNITCLGYDVTM